MELSTIQGACILTTGSAVPDSTISNNEISQVVETSNEWILTRTGIKERRLLTGCNQSVIDLAVIAAKRALQKIDMSPNEIDLIILATSSPNDLFGSASQVQAQIKAINSVAFDLTAACSGFVLGLVTASQFVQNRSYNTVLVIGADVLSKWIDWKDRSTCILFGDGAGAVILQACSYLNNGILGFNLNTDGNYSQQLSISYKEHRLVNLKSPIMQGSFNYITMDGKEVYKFAVSQVPLSILQCLKKLDINIEQVDWLLLHQANERILKAIAEKLSIDFVKVISNVSKYGNTSAASIPLALDEAVQQNKIKKNDLIVMSGFGAGLTWGTVIIKWTN